MRYLRKEIYCRDVDLFVQAAHVGGRFSPLGPLGIAGLVARNEIIQSAQSGRSIGQRFRSGIDYLTSPDLGRCFLARFEQSYFPNPDFTLLLGPFQNAIYHDRLPAPLRIPER